VVEDGGGGAVRDFRITVSNGDFLGVCGTEDVDSEEGGVIIPGGIEGVEGESVGAAAEDHLPAGKFIVLVGKGEASS